MNKTVISWYSGNSYPCVFSFILVYVYVISAFISVIGCGIFLSSTLFFFRWLTINCMEAVQNMMEQSTKSLKNFLLSWSVWQDLWESWVVISVKNGTVSKQWELTIIVISTPKVLVVADYTNTIFQHTRPLNFLGWMFLFSWKLLFLTSKLLPRLLFASCISTLNSDFVHHRKNFEHLSFPFTINQRNPEARSPITRKSCWLYSAFCTCKYFCSFIKNVFK